MIDTDKVIGFYTDVFGNEINEYEQISRYTVNYKGRIFLDDVDGWNEFKTDNWQKAIDFYNTYENDIDIYIEDNQYGIIWNGSWV